MLGKLAALAFWAVLAGPWASAVGSAAVLSTAGVVVDGLARGGDHEAASCSPCEVRGGCVPAAALPNEAASAVPPGRGAPRPDPPAGPSAHITDIPTPPPRPR